MVNIGSQSALCKETEKDFKYWTTKGKKNSERATFIVANSQSKQR